MEMLRGPYGLITVSILASLYVGAGAQNSYACPPGTKGWPCLRNTNGDPLTIKVVFMDKAFVTSNPAAVAKVNSLGRNYIPGTTCDRPDLAVPECFIFENWNGGWVGAFMQKVLKDLGVNVIAMTKANFSAAAVNISTPSSFTRCVWDVKFGNVDLCVGDFWETPERRNLTAFTAAIDSDSFTLYTTMNQSAILPAFNPRMFMAIFAPFDNSVWLLCGITILVCSVALRAVQSPREEAPDHNESADTDHADIGKKTENSQFESLLEFLKELPQAIWDTTMSFLGGEDAVVDASTNWPGRFISIGLGIFVFIHVNSYTGSLAAYYVSNNMVQLGDITSLEDIKAQGGKLCLYQSMASATLPLISGAVPASQMIQMDNYGPMLEQLYQRKCLGAVVGKFETLTFIGASNVNFTVCTNPDDPDNFATCKNKSIPATSFNLNPATCGSKCAYTNRFCQLVRLQDPTISTITLSWEMPVRKDLEPWVSYAMLRIHTAGNLRCTHFFLAGILRRSQQKYFVDRRRFS
jgi:hypothetical protein